MYDGIGSGFGIPTLADIDGIRGLEVICSFYKTDGSPWLMAWHGDGSSVVGWPQRLNTFVSQPGSAPAVADLVNGNSGKEIVLMTSGGTYGDSMSPAELYIFAHDGTNTNALNNVTY